MNDVVIVGAGIGGISAAIDLAGAGARVCVVEKEAHPGGKMRQIELLGHPIDVGPTVLTMPWVFDHLFESVGRKTEDYLSIESSDLVARHLWHDGSKLDLYVDVDRSCQEIAEFAGGDQAAAYRNFCRYSKRIYEIVQGPFLNSQRPNALTMFSQALKLGVNLKSVDAHRTMWKALQGFFKDPRLVQLFARYATYSGSSPFQSPATLNLIAHVEREGVGLVKGGMISVAKALERLALELGVSFRFGQTVEEIVQVGNRASGVILKSGEIIESRTVVVNADVSALAKGGFGSWARKAVSAVAPEDRSLSALTLAMVAEVKGTTIPRHSVFFSRDYDLEFREIFGEGKLPSHPTVYICAQDRGELPFTTNEGEKERLFMIINAPAVADKRSFTNEEIERCTQSALTLVSEAGLDLKPAALKTTSPEDFNRLFPHTGGSIYGRASHGPFSSLSRFGSKTKCKGLFLTGGSVHPGAGVPMVILSGQLCASAVKTDLASMNRSRKVDMHGSISMP